VNILRLISPTNPPSNSTGKGELAIVRERILQTLLVVIGLATLIGLVALTVNSLIQHDYLTIPVYFALSAVVLAFVASRNWSYNLRVSIVLITFVITAAAIIWRDGLGGNGKLWLLVFTTLTTIFLGWKTGLGTIIFSELALIVTGYLVVNHLVSVPTTSALSGAVASSEWIALCVFFGILSGVITFSINMMVDGLASAYNRVNRLSQDLTDERASLQKQVEKRTSQIQQRLSQVLTAAEVTKTIVSYRETDTLLPQIVNLIRDRFDLYYVGVFIVDESNNAVLRAGTGDAGEKMLAAGHRLAVGGSSMIGWAVVNRASRVSQDVGSETVRFNNPYLPKTRSELAIPIISRGQSLGALTIQSEQSNAFDAEDIQILEGVADSLAIALENSRLFEQAQEALDEVRTMDRDYLQQSWLQASREANNLSYTFENKDFANDGHSTSAHSPDGGTPESMGVVQIPLSLRDQIIGQITLETSSPSLSPAQMELIDAITTQTALALENARLLNETQQRALQEQTLNKLTADFSRATTMDEILQSALRQLSQLPAVQEISVQLVSPSTTAGTKNGNGHNGNGKEAHR
jgi:GAF domain-containing protein